MTPLDKFHNLPARVRDEILDKHRHYNTEHIDWWDGVYDAFKHDMDAIGIEVERMYFSGFWSQGDGAMFEGRVFGWEDFLKSLGYEDAALITHASQFVFRVSHSGHYYHENCTDFYSNLPLPESADDEDFAIGYSEHERGSLHEAVWLALLNGYDEASFEAEFIAVFKNHMRELYNRLEAEYDDLTSDESVLASLDANDMLTDIIDELESKYA